MNPFLWLIVQVLNIYFYIILAVVILSWLMSFNIVNPTNPYVRQVAYALRRLTEPLLAPIRRFMPDLGGLDISPIILLLAIQFAQYFIVYYGVRYL